jgi:hypothetical protein
MIVANSHIAAWGIFALCGLVSLGRLISKIFLPRRNEQIRPKKPGRELTTTETIAAFAIGFSALYLGVFIAYKGWLHNMAFTIPMFVIFFAIRLFYFSKELAALQTPKPASN